MRRRLLYLVPVVIFGVIAGNFLWGLISDRDPSAIPSVMIDQPVPEFELGPIAARQRRYPLNTVNRRTPQKIVQWCGPSRDRS